MSFTSTIASPGHNVNVAIFIVAIAIGVAVGRRPSTSRVHYFRRKKNNIRRIIENEEADYVPHYRSRIYRNIQKVG